MKARYLNIGIALIASSVLLGVTDTALATTTKTAQMDIKASVPANCTISATSLEFGSFDPIAQGSNYEGDGQGELNVACTKDSSATISLSTTGHTLKNGSEELIYKIYSDANRTSEWGTAANAVTYTGTGSQTQVHVYGRITSGQSPIAGSYADSLTFQIEY